MSSYVTRLCARISSSAFPVACVVSGHFYFLSQLPGCFPTRSALSLRLTLLCAISFRQLKRVISRLILKRRQWRERVHLASYICFGVGHDLPILAESQSPNAYPRAKPTWRQIWKRVDLPLKYNGPVLKALAPIPYLSRHRFSHIQRF